MNSMYEQIKIGWKNLAFERIDLRYPKTDLGVSPPSGLKKQGSIMMQTFVSNKEGDLICLVIDNYVYTSNDDVFESVNQFKNRFEERCKLILDNFIFNKETSITEPYLKSEHL